MGHRLRPYTLLDTRTGLTDFIFDPASTTIYICQSIYFFDFSAMHLAPLVVK
jgi:hypothetical protein